MFIARTPWVRLGLLFFVLFGLSGVARADICPDLRSTPGIDGGKDPNVGSDPGKDDPSIFIRCEPDDPPLPPPPPPPPPIVLDDEFTQLNYDYVSRVGDLNGDGYTDVYIKRQNGNSNNGVIWESVGLGQSSGRLRHQPYNYTIYAAARTMPLVDVVSAGIDIDEDGYVDPTVRADNPATGLVYDHSFLSSGVEYQRYGKGVIAWDEDVDKYLSDLREVALDDTYFANAKEPDQEGYEVVVFVEFAYCYTSWWFPYCYVFQQEIDLGFVPLWVVGVASTADPTIAAGSIVGDAAPFAAAPGATGKTSQKAQAMDAQGVAAVADPQVSTLFGTAAERDVSRNYFGLVDNPTDEIYYCVWYCGYVFYFTWDGYNFIRWYDRWTRVTREGAFDDANFSRAAYDTWQAEQEMDALLNALPNQRSVEDILGAHSRQEDARRRGFGYPFPNPGEIIVPRVEEAAESTWEAVVEQIKILRNRWKIKKECRKASVDPEACIAAMEDEIIGESEMIGSSETAEGAIGGVWTPETMDEDNMRRQDSRMRDELGSVVVAFIGAAAPGRWQCSYEKRHNSRDLVYYGITSIDATQGDCWTAVIRRSQAHDRSLRFRSVPGGWRRSDLDRELNAGGNWLSSQLVARQVIRGREQQLIDTYESISFNGTTLYGIDAMWFDYPNNRLFNLIRSVSKYNDLGCAMWFASNGLWVNIAPYTGVSPPTCPP